MMMLLKSNENFTFLAYIVILVSGVQRTSEIFYKSPVPYCRSPISGPVVLYYGGRSHISGRYLIVELHSVIRCRT